MIGYFTKCLYLCNVKIKNKCKDFGQNSKNKTFNQKKLWTKWTFEQSSMR